MAIKDWNGFKKSGDTYIPNDATARAGAVELVKSTTGWLGENRFNGKATSKTDQYGVTWTVDANDNNIVTVSGTPTGFEAFAISSSKVLPAGSYKLSGLENTVNVAYNVVRLIKNGVEVRVILGGDIDPLVIEQSDDYDTLVVELKRLTNNVACSGTAKIMITTPEEYALSPTYESYHESVEEEIQDIYEANTVLGASWNELDVTASGKTENGVTFTINADKSITFVTEAGGATADTSIAFNSNFQITDANTHYYSGVTNGGADKYYLECYYRDNSNTYKGNTRVYDGVIPIKVSDYSGATKINTFILMVKSGFISTTPITVYPMVAPKEDALYAPYAMTNRELTEMLTPKLLPSGANLNNYTKEEEYFAGAGTYDNCPISNTAFRFKVIPFNAEASRCIQIIYSNKAEPEVYMRTNFGGTWQSWYKFTGTVVS